MNHLVTATGAPSPAALSDRAIALLSCGAAVAPVFLGSGLIQGATREGFDFSRNALSQLSLGPLGWIQISTFLVTGGLALAAAVGLREALRGGPGESWVPRLIGVFGASFLLAGVFRAEPGQGFPAGAPEGAPESMSTEGAIHLAGATIGFLALCAAFLILARRFAAEGQRGWALASRVVPVGVLVGTSASAASMAAFTAGAGLGLIWLSAIATRLVRQRGRIVSRRP